MDEDGHSAMEVRETNTAWGREVPFDGATVCIPDLFLMTITSTGSTNSADP